MNLEQENNPKTETEEKEVREEEPTIEVTENENSEEKVVEGAEVAAGDEGSVEKENSEESEAEEHTASEEEAGSGVEEENSGSTDAQEYYSTLVGKAKEYAALTDWALASSELGNLAAQIEDGPEPTGDEAKALIEEFEEIRTDFEERKKAHYEELNRKKEENLAKKKELLKELGEIVSGEKWTATKEVNQIASKWEQIKLIPQDETEALNERFTAFIKEFESHKVDRLVKRLEKEEDNLMLKLVLLDKMEKLNKESDSEDVDFKVQSKKFDELISQWRKIGRVPVDKNEAVWDRFNKAQDDFNELRFKHDKEYRKSVEKALQKKKKLIAEAESLIDDDNIAEAARRVNKLHKAWKKTANLPQKDENELWEQFKAATDAFNEKKSENIDQLRAEEQANLEAKMKLIEKAEELKDTEDFDAGHKAMQSLMDQWKNAGPVPRKKSSKIWKQFKAAMDEFYERRREHFKDVRGEQKENLSRKKELIEKLEQLGSHEDPAKAVEEAKGLQAEFKKIGHVPFKLKNKIWKEYREACDVIYERYRSLGSDLGLERKLASQGIEPADRKKVIKLQKEQSALKKDISKLESESIQYEEAKTYFKPTNKGNKLRDELQEKIDKVEEELEKKNERLMEIEKELDLITRSSQSDEEE